MLLSLYFRQLNILYILSGHTHVYFSHFLKYIIHSFLAFFIYKLYHIFKLCKIKIVF